MSAFRFILSEQNNGPANMAADEALFTSAGENSPGRSALRLYRWSAPCVTIGYFQRCLDFTAYGLPVTRRLTGGLSVLHGDDISYALATHEADWPSVYDQERTYHLVHSWIREALACRGIPAEFYPAGTLPQPGPGKSNLCVQSFFPYDLHVRGSKIAGSSQRRKGKTLLVQGSLHLKGLCGFNDLAPALKEAWKKEMPGTLESSGLSPEERALMQGFIDGKYGRQEWNEKF
ncbi:MAG: lipoate--protein ligase family protein [Endomicrobiales bacterium]